MRVRTGMCEVLVLSFGILYYNGNHEFSDDVPIDNFPEKDFYHAHPDISVRSQIIDSRSIVFG